MSSKWNPLSTIVITAATGSLGSALIKVIISLFPGRFKLLLTCRNTEDERSAALTDFLKSESADFSLERLDLSDFLSVKTFTESVKSRIGKGELPGFGGGGIVNCAAYLNFSPDAEIQREIYSTNTLGPALLIRELLPVLISGVNTIVINIGTSALAQSCGRLDHFHKEGQMTALEGPVGYGSAKQLLLMITYVFQRKVYALNPQTKLKFMSLDPGTMNGPSRLCGEEPNLFFKILIPTLTLLGPVLRMVKKAAINPPEVPAKAIASMFTEDQWVNDEIWEKGKNFVLDDEVKSSDLSLDEVKQDEVWGIVMKELELPEAL